MPISLCFVVVLRQTSLAGQQGEGSRKKNVRRCGYWSITKVAVCEELHSPFRKPVDLDISSYCIAIFPFFTITFLCCRFFSGLSSNGISLCHAILPFPDFFPYPLILELPCSLYLLETTSFLKFTLFHKRA